MQATRSSPEFTQSRQHADIKLILLPPLFSNGIIISPWIHSLLSQWKQAFVWFNFSLNSVTIFNAFERKHGYFLESRGRRDRQAPEWRLSNSVCDGWVVALFLQVICNVRQVDKGWLSHEHTIDSLRWRPVAAWLTHSPPFLQFTICPVNLGIVQSGTRFHQDSRKSQDQQTAIKRMDNDLFSAERKSPHFISWKLSNWSPATLNPWKQYCVRDGCMWFPRGILGDTIKCETSGGGAQTRKL